MIWIDSHCHLDAPEFGPQPAVALVLRSRAAKKGVVLCVFPAVHAANFEGVRTLAQTTGDGSALGIHPLYLPATLEPAGDALGGGLTRSAADIHLVAVGEIGLD